MPPPNPVGDLVGTVGDTVVDPGSSAFDAAMTSIWSFGLELLDGSLATVDRYTTPDVNPLDGPLAGVLPMTLWLGLATLMLLAFVQIGRAVAIGGRGLARIAVGLFQYVVVSAAGLGVLDTMLTASNAVATGILSAGLHTDRWQSITGDDAVLKRAEGTVSGTGLGIIALLCLIPAGFFFLVEFLARNAGVLVLAAAIPVVAAGLISDTSRAWFWTTFRWLIALVLMPPGVALTLVIGMRVAGDPAQASVAAVVSGVVLLLSLAFPLLLFKLLAFVNPGTPSGAAARNFLSSRSSASGAGIAVSSERNAEAAGEGRFAHVLAVLDAARTERRPRAGLVDRPGPRVSDPGDAPPDEGLAPSARRAPAGEDKDRAEPERRETSDEHAVS
ncbi:hypothetical protein [Actinoplanes sp. NPDC051494]|uniref:hypothetical protein n=1 Tax=Actinoplanes sp. NPDC051494 TaxID=3363907 RepID=UPI0037AA480D